VTGLQKIIVDTIGLDRIKASKDPYLNDIPLAEWDALAERLNFPCAGSFGLYGGSLSQRVCILKDAARALI
jgi:hypothetical protein